MGRSYSYFRNQYVEMPRPRYARVRLAAAGLVAMLSALLILTVLAPTHPPPAKAAVADLS
jgi:hypothetical protein